MRETTNPLLDCSLKDAVHFLEKGYLTTDEYNEVKASRLSALPVSP